MSGRSPKRSRTRVLWCLGGKGPFRWEAVGCSTRTPLPADCRSADLTPAQVDAITDAVREAADHSEHVTPDQQRADLATLQADISIAQC